MKQRLIATALISVAWSALDFLFHGVLLMGEYTATASLWRPVAEMKNGMMTLVTVLTALVFVLIYCQLIKEKTMKNGIKLGGFIGLLVGIGMSLGTYSYMPITIKIAVVWFIAVMVKYIVSGAITGYLVKKEIS
ncbi:hypothetical protein HOG98_08395 [bacterium]|jgi:hypothetical protein|nr:hypothetical protein [bacterium]